MLRLADRIVDQSRLSQIDLVGELQSTRVGHCPHRSARRGQRGDDLVEHRVVELGWRNLASRQLGNLVDQPLDLALARSTSAGSTEPTLSAPGPGLREYSDVLTTRGWRLTSLAVQVLMRTRARTMPLNTGGAIAFPLALGTPRKLDV